MKLLKLAFFALTLLAFAPLLFGLHHTAPGAPNVALAMEPASWILVGLGLVGGGFLHRRRHPALNLTVAVAAPAATSAMVTDPASATRSPAAPRRVSLLPAEWRLPRLHAFVTIPGKLCAAAAAALLLLLTAPFASADSITFSAQAVPSFVLGPSADTFSLDSETGSVDPSTGDFVFQTGDFVIGNSQISDQVIPFSFQDTITLNGITQTLTLYGQDAVTSTADTLTIFGSPTFAFGDESFTVQPFTLSEADMGDFPIALDATVTPEPGSLLLLGTGIIVGALFLAKRNYA